MSNNFLPERDRKGSYYFDKTNIFSIFFQKASKQLGIIVIHLLQDMRNHDFPDESRFVADGVPGAVLVDQRQLLLVEKDAFAMPAGQFFLLFAPEVRIQVVFLRALFACHTIYII